MVASLSGFPQIRRRAVPQEMCPKGSMVAFPEKLGEESREGPYNGRNPRGNPKGSGGADQDHGKGALGGPNEGEEGEIYLENHPTKANGYYTRDLLTLVSPLKDLIVPRVRECNSLPWILPYRKRASLELSEIVLALYAVGVSTRKISHFLEGIYGAFYSPQSISRLIQVTAEEVNACRERPLSEEYYAVFLDGTFLSVRRGKTTKEPVYMALGIKPDGRREILGFCLSRRRGKLPELGGGA